MQDQPKVRKKPTPPPPPFGNKYGVGHGRPCNPGYSDKEVIQLGEDLLAWMKKVDDEDLDVVHLSEWYSEIKEIPYSQWVSMVCSRPCFLGYHERAMAWMGKRTMRNKDLSTAYGSRFLGIYCKDVREHEKQICKEKIQNEIESKMIMEQKSQIPFNQEKLDSDDENIRLKAEIVLLKQKLGENADK